MEFSRLNGVRIEDIAECVMSDFMSVNPNVAPGSGVWPLAGRSQTRKRSSMGFEPPLQMLRDSAAK